MLRLVVTLGALWLSTSCAPANAATGGEAGAAPLVDATVRVGVPGGTDGLEFTELPDGSELRLQTLGQGGTHVLVAVRCIGFGNRAFVSAELQNLTTGKVVEEPAPVRPQLLYCGDSGACDLVPYLVHASGLTSTDAEKDGLRVRLTATVRSAGGVSAQGSVEAVLSTADL